MSGAVRSCHANANGIDSSATLPTTARSVATSLGILFYTVPVRQDRVADKAGALGPERAVGEHKLEWVLEFKHDGAGLAHGRLVLDLK